jgi:hypothetical protein
MVPVNLFVEQLVQLVPPPRRQSVSPIWAEVEGSMGFELPGDYKELAALYGPGKFDDFLVIFHPRHPVSRLNLSPAVTEAAEVLREFEASGEVLPAPADQLLAIALTDNGDTVYWVREPSGSPDRWRIAVNGARDFDEWHLFDGCLAQFLVSVLSRAWVVPAFAEDFPWPDRAPVFTPRDRGVGV